MPKIIQSIHAIIILLTLLPSHLAAQVPGPNQPGDPRNIKNGSVIPDEGYSDQPYVVITNDGAWLCVMKGCRGRRRAAHHRRHQPRQRPHVVGSN